MTGQQSAESRLAAAGQARQPHDLAGFDGDVDIVDDERLAVCIAIAQCGGCQHGVRSREKSFRGKARHRALA